MAGTQHQYRKLIVWTWLVAASLVPVLATAALPPDAAVLPLAKPTWANLSEKQKEVLAPLEKEWNQLELQRRIKWLGIADRYSTMHPEEQDRIRKQMLNWAQLSPEERRLAREKYKNLKQVTPDQQEAIKQKWNEYQELPQDERQRLKQKASERKPRKALVQGPIKPLSTPPALKLAPTTKNTALFPASWPDVVPGPIPTAGAPLFPLPVTSGK